MLVHIPMFSSIKFSYIGGIYFFVIVNHACHLESQRRVDALGLQQSYTNIGTFTGEVVLVRVAPCDHPMQNGGHLITHLFLGGCIKLRHRKVHSRQGFTILSY